jgi:hypothetical protein
MQDIHASSDLRGNFDNPLATHCSMPLATRRALTAPRPPPRPG